MFKFLKRTVLAGTLVASMALSVLTAAPAAAAGTATLTFNPASTSVPVGGSFSVPLMINDTGNTLGDQFGVTFDGTVLTLTSVTDGTFFSSYAAGITGCSTFNQPWFPGTTNASAVGADSLLGTPCGAGPTGTGTLATFNFTAKAGVNAITAINLTAVSGTGTQISGATTVVIPTTLNMTVGTPPAPKLAVTGATTTAVSGTPTQFNVSYAVANTGTAAADNATHSLTVVVTTGSTTLSTDTFTLPLAAGASTATKTDGPFTLSGTLESITITADSAGTAGGPATGNTAYQYSALSSSGNTTLNATLGAFITLTAPPSLNSLVLNVGPNSYPDGNLGVSSNVNFQVTADGTNNGFFAQWSGTAFLTPLVQLINALIVQSGATNLTLTGVPQNFVSGTTTGEPAGGYAFPITFSQTVATNDAPVKAPNTYNEVVTFAATGSF
jgi:hypothetical protein